MLNSTPLSVSRPSRDHYDVIIVGSGMGGGTLAFALKDAGITVLLIERGGFVPQEPQNWDPDAVFRQGRYKNAENWYDAEGRPFSPGTYYYVGGNTKFYGSSLVRFRHEDFQSTAHQDGESPAWPFDYDDLAPHYSRAEKVFNVHGELDDPDPAAKRTVPLPRNRPRTTRTSSSRTNAETREDSVDDSPRHRSTPGRFLYPVRNLRRIPLQDTGQSGRRRVLCSTRGRRRCRRTADTYSC